MGSVRLKKSSLEKKIKARYHFFMPNVDAYAQNQVWQDTIQWLAPSAGITGAF